MDTDKVYLCDHLGDLSFKLIKEIGNMAEYGYPEAQTVLGNTAALLNDIIACPKGYVIHRGGSGILTLRGIVNNPCGRFARYRVHYGANIAVPTGGTVGEIRVGLAIGGEVVPTSIAKATPTVAEAYWNVSGFANIDVPTGCCFTVSVDNATVSGDPILMDNLNVEVTRVA